MCDKLLQLSNADVSIVTTESGILTDVRDLAPLKSSGPMMFTELLIVRDVINVLGIGR